MKYFPLIWAALWRKPTRTILTLLSVTAAFTLFGLAVGVNATYADIAARLNRPVGTIGTWMHHIRNTGVRTTK